jgi:hypothetical protein
VHVLRAIPSRVSGGVELEMFQLPGGHCVRKGNPSTATVGSPPVGATTSLRYVPRWWRAVDVERPRHPHEPDDHDRAHTTFLMTPPLGARPYPHGPKRDDGWTVV